MTIVAGSAPSSTAGGGGGGAGRLRRFNLAGGIDCPPHENDRRAAVLKIEFQWQSVAQPRRRRVEEVIRRGAAALQYDDDFTQLLHVGAKVIDRDVIPVIRLNLVP